MTSDASEKVTQHEPHLWFWASDIENLQEKIRYRLGRGHFVKHPLGSDVVHIGVAVPKDVTDYDADDPEHTIAFENTLYYTAPLFEGHGYLVTRTPCRAMMHQHYREQKGGISISNELHPSRQPDGEVNTEAYHEW